MQTTSAGYLASTRAPIAQTKGSIVNIYYVVTAFRDHVRCQLVSNTKFEEQRSSPSVIMLLWMLLILSDFRISCEWKSQTHRAFIFNANGSVRLSRSEPCLLATKNARWSSARARHSNGLSDANSKQHGGTSAERRFSGSLPWKRLQPHARSSARACSE